MSDKEKEKPIVLETDNTESFQLLESAVNTIDITMRDDQMDFAALLDAVKICRRNGRRFRLIDSGIYERPEMEWVIDAGADLYTSDQIGRDLNDLEYLSVNSRKKNSIIAYFIHADMETGEDPDPTFPRGLINLGRSGIYLHISNRENERNYEHLEQLAYSCWKGGSCLIYYHHGLLEPTIVNIAHHGSWIHLSDNSIKSAEDIILLHDIRGVAQAQGSNLVFYVEKGLDYSWLDDILKANIFVLFKSAPIEYRSPLKKLEKKAARRELDHRAYYLYTTFLL